MSTVKTIRNLSELTDFGGQTDISLSVNHKKPYNSIYSSGKLIFEEETFTRFPKPYSKHRFDIEKQNKRDFISQVLKSYGNIFEKNSKLFGLLYNHKKVFKWILYLDSLNCLLFEIGTQLEDYPDEELSKIYVKLQHTFNDSYEDFRNFLTSTYGYCFEMIFDTIDSMLYSLAETEEPQNYDYDDFVSKQKQIRKYRDKKISVAKKNGRKNKHFEQDLELKQYSQTDCVLEENMMDFSIPTCISDAHDALILVEEALKSPCVENAAWAIHMGLEDEYSRDIEKAEMLMKNYQKILDIYEGLIYKAERNCK